MATQLPPPGDPNTLYVLDLLAYVFRAYHGVQPLSNSKGEPTHATYGVANMLGRLVKDQRPAYLAVALDSKPEDNFRRQLYPEYKANRPPPPPDLGQQIQRCRELVDAYAIPALYQHGYEADDIIAACVREARGHGLTTVICSADKDLMQLVDEKTLMWDAMRNRVYGVGDVVEKWGVTPNHVCDLLALMGDTSDNVPGVTGIGEKTAARLVNEYGSLDGVYANLDKLKGKLKENLAKDRDNAKLSLELVCLAHDLPVKLDLDTLRYGGWDPARVRALLTELEFTRLLAVLEETVSAASAARASQPALAVSTTDESATGDTPAIDAPAALVPSAPPVVEKHYTSVLDRASLEAAVAACRAKGRFAVDTETTSLEAPRAELVGISLAWEADHGVYIPIAHRVIGDPPQLSIETVREVLGPLLADPSVMKCGHNIKYDDIVLRRANLPVNGFGFDSMLASYLLDPERHAHRLDDVARTEFGYTMIAYDTVTQKARGKQLAFEEVDIARATQYSAEDADIAAMLYDKLRPRLDEDEAVAALMDTMEVPLALVLGRMEEHGVLIDAAKLRALADDVGKQLATIEAELHAMVGRTFNVGSPKQLETILFDERKLPVKKRTKTSRSTDHEVLEELAELDPLPAKILEHRQLAKLKGTYLDQLPDLADANGRIHTSYNQAVAATGRLSSNNPNLQNIPVRTELGRRIRHAFVAPPGMRIMAADYSQIELRVLAHLSRDPILLDAFTTNEDIHTRTAMEIFRVEKSQVTREMRNRAKTTNFAVIYGQGDSALARQLDVSRVEAAQFIETYFKTFPRLARFLDETVERARTGEGVRTILGRRRFLPNLESTNRGLRMQAERIAKNTPVQGTSADIMKRAMVTIAHWLDAEKLATKMVLTVHDELVFEVPANEEKVVEAGVRERMSGALALDVPLVVDVGWGASWGEAH